MLEKTENRMQWVFFNHYSTSLYGCLVIFLSFFKKQNNLEASQSQKKEQKIHWLVFILSILSTF